MQPFQIVSQTDQVPLPGGGLQTAQQQIQTDSSQIAQFQQLLQVLQQRGMIFIDQNGQIYLPGR